MQEGYGGPQKLKTELLQHPTIPLLGRLEKCENGNLERFLYISVHRSIIHKTQIWKQLKLLLMDDWKSKMWYMHAMEYYSALKRRENMTL